MAQLAKKLYVYRNADGVTYSANLYSTTTEAMSGKFPVYVDGVGQAYAAVSGSGAIPCYINDGSTTYTLHQMAQVPYGSAMYTSAGTFTVPANVTRVRVTLVGGGGGGSMAMHVETGGCMGSDYYYGGGSGGAGGTSSAFGLSATGGGGGYSQASSYTATGSGGSGGSPSGRSGGSISYSSYRSFPARASGFTVNGGSYGYGGYYVGNGSNQSMRDYGAGSGGSGGYVYTTVAVTSGASYSISVGGRGSTLTAYDCIAVQPIQGCVFVEWGGGI